MSCELKTMNAKPARLARGSRSRARLWTAWAVSAASLGLGEPALRAQELVPNRPADQRPLLDNPLAGWGTEYTNWVEVSFGNFFVDGSRAAFLSRQQVPRGAFGGIESLHVEQAVGKKGLFQLDGRGLFDNHDYDLRLDYTEEGKGYLRAGFSQFRTWYDRHGGFYPRGDVWLSPFERDVAVDRGEIWFEGGLRLPNVPELTFRYSHQFREGEKDSTSWGDVNVTPGAPATLRLIAPSFLALDEQRDTFEFDLKHRLDKTDFGVGMRYELSEQDNRRYILRRPGEVRLDRAVTQKDGMDTELFNAHAFTQTRFSERVLLTSGYAFTTLETALSGSRVVGAGFEAVYDPLFGRRQGTDEEFLGLNGGSTLQQYLFNLNLMVLPWEHLSLVPAVRVEEENENGSANFLSSSGGVPPTIRAVEEQNQRNYLDVGESLEARYNGLTNWLFYARGEWLQDNGNLKEREAATRTPRQNTDSERFTQKYCLGLNWYPLRPLNFSGQYYHKIHTVQYDNILVTDNPPVGYPVFMLDENFETDDTNFRINWRPLATLTLVTRYDFQLSTIDTRTRADELGDIQTAESTSHIISQSVSWNPWSRLYLQGSLNYVLDSTDTPANHRVGAAEDVVLTSENNYWNVSLVAGYALNPKTDLQVQYYYYRADNYQDNSASSQPYGAGAEENGVTLTLIRQLSRAVRWTLKYGLFTNHDQTYGGHADYTAHMVYTSLQYRF